MFKKKKEVPKKEGIEPVVKKSRKGSFKRILDKYNFLKLKEDIESYGFEYSFKKFILAALVYVAAVIGVSLYIKLNVVCISVLVVLMLLMVPFLIKSQFDQRYQINRFDMVSSYLDNVIPLFKKHPSIVSAWSSISDLLEGEMQEAVSEALELVMTNTDDESVYQSAFEIIESRFPNSRIHSVHKIMYTIETKNTLNYVSAVDNIWYDVQLWITRVAGFQKDIAKRRTDLMIISLLSLFSNCLFASMYSTSEVFDGFTKDIIYQSSSTIFIGLLLIAMCIFQVKLTGMWLLDDKTVDINKKAVKSFNIITDGQHDDKIKPMDRVIAVLMVVAGALVYYKVRHILVIGVTVLMAYMAYTSNKRNYQFHIANIKKFLQLEFPTWMRDISINLQNLTVINSIEASKETSSTIFAYYVNNMLEGIYEDPASIKPFNDFLRSFKIDGVLASMKLLYSMQSLNKDDMDKQINDMVIRNQDMLAQAEKMRNDAAVGKLKLLGFVPVVVLVLQMLVSMGLLFKFMLNFMTMSLAM